MNAVAKSRTNIFAAIGSLFSSGVDIEEVEDIKLPTELSDALKSLEGKEKNAERAINTETNSSKKGGFAKKIDPKTEQAMRAMHNQVKEKSEQDKELEL